MTTPAVIDVTLAPPATIEVTVGVATGGGGSGTVTQVAMTAPPEFSVSGSPITTSGVLDLSWDVQAANRVFAGPTSGGDSSPYFRALVTADLPSHTHGWAQVTGTPTTLSGYGITDGVTTARQIIAGTGLSGGGTLAADRTLAVVYGTSAGTACEGNDSRLANPDAVILSPTSGTRNIVRATVNDTTSLTVRAATSSFGIYKDAFVVEDETGAAVFRVQIADGNSYRDVILPLGELWFVTGTGFATSAFLRMQASGGSAAGSINTSAGVSGAGGSITTNNSGGGINTANGGGSINTAGTTGSIQFGAAATRTTLNGSGSTVTVTLPGITGTLASLAGDQTITGVKTFSHQTILIRDAAVTWTAGIECGTLSANRTITVPNLTGTLCLLEGAQTITGTKTFNQSAATSTWFVCSTGGSPTDATTPLRLKALNSGGYHEPILETPAALRISSTFGGVAAQFRLLPFGNDIYFQNTVTSGKMFFGGTGGVDITGEIRFQSGGASNVIVGPTAAAAGAKLCVHSTAAATVGAFVRGASSQSADLQQWQDNGGSVLASIGADGSLLAAGLRVGVASVSSSPYAVAANVVLVAVDTSAARTINLPAATTGRVVIVKDATGGAGANNITINRAGADTIDGGTSVTINTNRGVVRLVAVGTNWNVV